MGLAAGDRLMRLVPTVIVITVYSLAFVGHVSAASRLLNYESRVVRAAEQIERIKTDKEYADEGISYIRRLLPRSEQIEFDGREVTADNTWLYVLLDSYGAEKDQQQRVARLNEAAGRLRALDEHLRRADAEASANENAREKIREILSRRPYQPEPETVVGKFVKRVLRKVRAIAGEVLTGLQRLLEKILGAGATGGWASRIVLLLLLAVAGFFIVQLARRRRSPRTKRKVKTRLILGEEISADHTSAELAEAGLAAARAGDFRTAVRKLYVSLLYELSERSLIELEDGATNHEYLRKVARFNVLAAPMRLMTDRFDYVWYGMFPSSPEEFASYRASYEDAMEEVKILGDQIARAI